MPDWGFTTRILHADRKRGTEHGAAHSPVHRSVAYGYEKAADLAAVFQGKATGYLYSRQGNPTVAALQDKITMLEQGIGSLVFASGMGAIASLFLALCREGDHVVASQFLFGNTHSLFGTLDTMGVSVSFTDATDISAVEESVCENTRIVFVETIANPRTQIADLEAIGQLCQKKGIVYVVDNTMTSPWLFNPVIVKATLIVNSLTKYLSGHGQALGGAITATKHFDWESFDNIDPRYRKGDSTLWGLNQIRKKGLRDLGASLTADSAHNVAVGMETLALRMTRACENAQTLADYLHSHPDIEAVYYPGLSDHLQHDRAKQLFRAFGALFSFTPKKQADIFTWLNRLQLPIQSTNLGDNRTLIIPVAHTIYYEMGPERRQAMGIADNLLRVSVGIENQADLLGDFERALA